MKMKSAPETDRPANLFKFLHEHGFDLAAPNSDIGATFIVDGSRNAIKDSEFLILNYYQNGKPSLINILAHCRGEKDALAEYAASFNQRPKKVLRSKDVVQPPSISEDQILALGWWFAKRAVRWLTAKEAASMLRLFAASERRSQAMSRCGSAL